MKELIQKLITAKTRLIFISHVTCTTGLQLPIAEIGQLAKKHNIWFGLDGAQAAGAFPMNIVKCGVDFYTFSGHKWLLGPKRTGVLYVKKELQEIVAPITVGAYSDNGHNLETLEIKFQDNAQRYEYGTQNLWLFNGLFEGMKIIKMIGMERVQNHNFELAEQFYDGLLKLSNIKVISPIEKQFRTSMISFKPTQSKGSFLANTLTNKKDIRVRHIVEAGLDSVRAAFHIYNTEDDVHKILKALEELT